MGIKGLGSTLVSPRKFGTPVEWRLAKSLEPDSKYFRLYEAIRALLWLNSRYKISQTVCVPTKLYEMRMRLKIYSYHQMKLETATVVKRPWISFCTQLCFARCTWISKGTLINERLQFDITWTRGWWTFSVKGQTGNILDFASLGLYSTVFSSVAHSLNSAIVIKAAEDNR